MGLNAPGWVAPLAAADAFANPPGIVASKGDHDHQVAFEHWPEGDYLARMAPRVPDDVEAVLAAAETNGNPLVARALFTAAAALPDAHLPRLVGPAGRWVRTGTVDWYAEAAIAYLRRAVELGAGSAIDQLKKLLAVQPDRRYEQKSRSDDLPWRPLLEPSARLTDWEYKRSLVQLRPLARGPHARKWCSTLSQLVYDALRHSQWPDERGADESSMIWRPTIGEDGNSHDFDDVRGALISALRDAVVDSTHHEPTTFEPLVSKLMDGSIVHQRIALYVLSRSTQGIAMVDQRLSDTHFLDDHRFTNEIAGLLDRRWPELSTATQDTVLGWIDGGDEERFRNLCAESGSDPPTEADVARHRSRWQRDKYSFIARHLRGARKAYYDELVTIYGEADHADVETWTETGVWGSSSPDEAADMETWSPEQIRQYLLEWDPPTERAWPPEPTIEGLGTQLAGVATRRARELSAHAHSFADVDPTYIRGLIDGFEAAHREGTELHWGPVLQLASSVTHRPFEPAVYARDWSRDPGYRWVRRHVLSLISRGMEHGPNTVGWEHRQAIWDAVHPVAEDPNPTASEEATYGGEGDRFDALSLSLNSNRPYALHTVVRYGLWCHRNLSAEGRENPQASESFPEILSVLESHLDPQLDGSLAVRAVYGHWYPWLLLLDEQWATAHARDIFGSPEGATEHGNVGWDTYIIRNAPYDAPWRTLQRWYQRAVAEVPTDVVGRVDHLRNRHHRLGEHLVTYAWRGQDEDQHLARRYFEVAPDVLAGSVTNFVGRTLSNTSELSGRVAERIQQHWDDRVEILRAEPEAHLAELQAFASWYASAKLDPVWSMNKFEEAVDLGGAPKHATAAIERLAADDTDPVAAARVLATIVTRTEDPWENILWRGPAKTVLAKVTRDGDAREATLTIVDYFVRTGDDSFRQFAPD